MYPTTEDQRSLTGAIAKIAVLGLLMVIIRASRSPSGVVLEWEPDAFLSGALMGLTLIASDYARLPAGRRLAPKSAIVLGIVTLALLGVALALLPHADLDPGWRRYAIVVLALPSLYLIVAGARHARLP